MTFEHGTGFADTLSIGTLDSFSNFSAIVQTDSMTFEHGTGFAGTLSISNLGSFSNFSDGNIVADDALSIDGVSLTSFLTSNPFVGGNIVDTQLDTYEHGQGYFGTWSTYAPAPDFSSPDATLTDTLEHGQGYFGTWSAQFPSPDFSSPDATLTDGFETW